MLSLAQPITPPPKKRAGSGKKESIKHTIMEDMRQQTTLCQASEMRPHTTIVQTGDYNAGQGKPHLAIKMHSETGLGWG